MISNDIFKRKDEATIALLSIPGENLSISDIFSKLTNIYLDGKGSGESQWLEFQNSNVNRIFIQKLLANQDIKSTNTVIIAGDKYNDDMLNKLVYQLRL